MAPETCGPANTTTSPMTAAISTYSIIDWPLRRRVFLGDTPPRKEYPLHAFAAPFAQGLQYEPSVGLLQFFALVLPQRQNVNCLQCIKLESVAAQNRSGAA